MENIYPDYHTGPHHLCPRHMALIHGLGTPRKGIPGSTRSSEESWLVEALSVKQMEMFTLSSCPIWSRMARVN